MTTTMNQSLVRRLAVRTALVASVPLSTTVASGHVVSVDFNFGDCSIHNQADGVLSPSGARYWNGITRRDGTVRYLLDGFGTPTQIGYYKRDTPGFTQFCALRGTNFLQDTGIGSSSSQEQAKFRITGLESGTPYDLALYLGTGDHFSPAMIKLRHDGGEMDTMQFGAATNEMPGMRGFDYVLFERVEPMPLGGGVYGLKVYITAATAQGGQAIVTGFQISSGDCQADVDNNARVDVEDYLAVVTAWGHTGGPEDVNGDGFVDMEDLLMVLENWGPC